MTDAAEQLKRAEQAAKLHPNNPQLLFELGSLYFANDHKKKSLESFLRVVEMEPGSAPAHYYIGVIYNNLLQFQASIPHLMQAAKLAPQNPSILVPLGFACQRSGQLTEATQYFTQAIDSGIDSQLVFSGLGTTELWRGNYDAAMKNFRKAENAFLAAMDIPEPAQPLPLSKIVHDQQQLNHLSNIDALPPKYEKCLATLTALVNKNTAHSNNHTNSTARISQEELTQIAPIFGETIYRANGDRFPNGAINPDLKPNEIQKNYLQSVPELTYFDDFLTTKALDRLYRYCTESTIFKKSYSAGYVGSMLSEGFASPLLLQISEDLRTTLPAIFRDHKLIQAWAYKYDSRYEGIKVHADSAVVNVNFWISPDEGNLDSQSGGLEVWNEPAPKHWSFKDYNSDDQKIKAYLQETSSKSTIIPFRRNRILIFNASLFHRTDTLDFADEYLKRRINVTLLFGIGLKAA